MTTKVRYPALYSIARDVAQECSASLTDREHQRLIQRIYEALEAERKDFEIAMLRGGER